MEPESARVAAYLLIQQYGDNAEEYVAQKKWKCHQSGNEAAMRKWESIFIALKDIRALVKIIERQVS